MSQRLYDTTKWFWCLLILYSGPNWNPVRCLAVRTPSNHPSTIETQAKFFQDFFSVQLSPYKIEFGHVCEDPNTWEQRYEKKDFKNHRDMGKIRWGDKKGGYGEHYWDLNHAGHAGDQGHDHRDDDGSYNERDSGDPYDEPSDQSSNYDTASYDSENTAQHEDNGREKRAPKRIRTERVKEAEEPEQKEKPQIMRRPARKQKEEKYVQNEDNEKEGNVNQEVYSKPTVLQQRRPQKRQYNTEENKPTKEKNQVVLVVNEKEKEEKPVQFVVRNPEAKVFVPYEDGAGVRQHYQTEIAPAASVPRLFLEPTTGHVVDRATGQAYVLQPINRKPSYS